MKFNYKLSHNENMDVWQEHSLTAPHTQTSELSAEEKSWLLTLNESLRQLEDKYRPILDAKYRELQARVNDPSDWMNEFNLNYVISFYLREDDPEYDEADDNILTELQHSHFIHEGQNLGSNESTSELMRPSEMLNGLRTTFVASIMQGL